MIQNTKISFNTLLVVILLIAISNVIPDIPTLQKTEEIKESAIHLISSYHQSVIHSIGAGGDTSINLSLSISSKSITFLKLSKFESDNQAIDAFSLNSIPFFIRYCSLVFYS